MAKSSEKFFSQSEKEALVASIRAAELLTSGEIKLHLQSKCKAQPFEEAKKVFEKIGMTRTQEKNGILFFLSLEDKQFVILGDSGIHEKVHEEFWNEIRREVIDFFSQGKFAEGLSRGIKLCGEKLAFYFPRRADDQDELSNDISVS